MIATAAVALALTPSQSGTMHSKAQHRRHRKRARVVRTAASRQGFPYVFGAAGPFAFDCSGLVQWVYRASLSLNLPRTTWLQSSLGKNVLGRRLRRGDLVFAYGDSHVAIYAGHGSVIAAPRAGDVVKREPIAWLRPISSARRLIRR